MASPSVCGIVIFLMAAAAAAAIILSYNHDQWLPAARKGTSLRREHESRSSYEGCSHSEEKGLLPRDIVAPHSDLEMRPLVSIDDDSVIDDTSSHQQPREGITGGGGGGARRSLLAVAAGIKQKELVDAIASKFLSSDGGFSVMVFHYDGVVDEWGDLPWSSSAVHVSAINQTKWWFAKRFLHPDVVHPYDYIFLWDEDLGVKHFNPARYVAVVEEEGLQISQPGLDAAGAGSETVHYQLTRRSPRGKLHRRIYKSWGATRCYENSTGPPCTGWVEMMAPVFSRAAWRCVWSMIQNDLVHAWGLDLMLGYCAQGDRTSNVGVVDSEYLLHLAIPTLGASSASSSSSSPLSRSMVRKQAHADMLRFQARWKQAAQDDACWTDPYPH